MIWNIEKLSHFLKQYRIEHIVQNNREYKQVTISKHDGVRFRGIKKGNLIGRKRQFIVDLDKYPKTLLFVRQGVQDGSIGIAPDEVNGSIVTENMPMFTIENIDVNYLALVIQSSYFKSEVAKISTTGSAQKSIHERQLLEIKIPYPSENEQREIVKKYTTSKEKISKFSFELTFQVELISNLRKQILQDAIQGQLVPQDPNDEPASKLLEKIKAEKEKLIKERKLKKSKPLPPIKKEEIPFDIPDNWVWCRLDEITVLVTDGKHGDSRNEKNSGYYFLSAKDLQNGKFIYDDARQINYEDFLETHRRTNLEPDDICVVNTGATVGKTVLAPDDLLTPKTTFQKSVAVIKVVKKYINVNYIKHFIICRTPELLSTSRGSAINNLLLGDMKLMLVPLPPKNEQKRIVIKVEELLRVCDELEKEIKQNQNLTQQLLQSALKEALEPKVN